MCVVLLSQAQHQPHAGGPRYPDTHAGGNNEFGFGQDSNEPAFAMAFDQNSMCLDPFHFLTLTASAPPQPLQPTYVNQQTPVVAMPANAAPQPDNIQFQVMHTLPARNEAPQSG
jgi:hypothetical protein